MTPAQQAFWAAFQAASLVTGQPHEVIRFDNTPEVADQLLALVARGIKRATAALAADFDVAGRPPRPRPGDHALVCDGAWVPRLIFRTTEIVVKPMIEVDEAFAWDEGEGDRSRATWLRNHRRSLGEEAVRLGIAMHDAIPVVFERFTVVWPPELADR